MTEPSQHTENHSWADLGRFWTLPNILTMSRMILVLPITWLVLNNGDLVWIMSLVVIAIATDYFDGRLARWSDSESEWGRVLDPIADKMGGGLVVAALALRGSLPLWFLGVMVVRDLTILAGGAIIRRRTGRIVASMMSGKVAVTAVALTVLAALLRADQPVLEFCLWASVVLLVWSFFRYMIRFFNILYGRVAVD
ncbi:MAG: CDP-alcohol phosphatidyltransferase family protein [Rhodothermales bacterium]|nr:CDP-alcohol phosphatidyltransferase family protein [Rhodothermales bacterium]